MVVLLNLDGSANLVVPERVFQGSGNVTQVILGVPYGRRHGVDIGFKLPDETQIAYHPMTQAGTQIYSVGGQQLTMTMWSQTLTTDVTRLSGVVRMSFAVRSTENVSGDEVTTGILTTFMVDFTVEPSNMVELPPIPPQDVYDELRHNIDIAIATAEDALAEVTPIKMTASATAQTHPPGEDSTATAQVTAKEVTPGKYGYEFSFAFGLEKGEKGNTGDEGKAATVNVGETVTGAPGTNASVVNVGTEHAAVLKFTVPKGATGESLSVYAFTVDDGQLTLHKEDKVELDAAYTITDFGDLRITLP